jgi:hypothetical protein
VQLDGNVAAAPASTGNFIVSPGVGFQAGGGSWTALSDARIKTVKDDYMNGLEAVRALRPVAYVYKGNDALPSGMSMHEQAAKDGTVFVGLIAQEAEQVFPDMVTKTAGVIDGQPVTDLRSMNMTPLTFALINAVKTLAGRIEQLEAQRVA